MLVSELSADRRILLIGQAPGPNTDPGEPLPLEPRSSTAGRLCMFIGVHPNQFRGQVQRVNLLQYHPGRRRHHDRFPEREGRVAAQAMMPLLSGRAVVLLGRKVAKAFGAENAPFHEWLVPSWCSYFAVAPHPSGRNHWYNDEGNRRECREFWQEALGDQKLLRRLLRA